MRLITFQDNSALSVLDDGVWYSRRGRRVKPIDQRYIDEGKGTYPVYTFATTGQRFTPYFGIRSFATSLSHLSGFMQFDLPGMVMFELEVPESFILNMKQNSCWYCERCKEDDPELIASERERKSGKWVYWKADFSNGVYFEDNYLQHVRELRREHELEAVIPCIRKEHVVAIRGFQSIKGGYGDHACKTLYVNEDLCPMWDCSFIINGEAHTRVSKNTPDIVKQQIAEIKSAGRTPCVENVLQHYCGAKAVPGYFTVAEALQVANYKLSNNIIEMIIQCGISKDSLDSVYISGRQGAVLMENGTYIESRALEDIVGS